MDNQVLSALRRIEKRLVRIEAAVAKLNVPAPTAPPKRRSKGSEPARRIRVPSHL